MLTFCLSVTLHIFFQFITCKNLPGHKYILCVNVFPFIVLVLCFKSSPRVKEREHSNTNTALKVLCAQRSF